MKHLFLALALVACASVAPTPAPPRSPTPVAAPALKTWSAVVDVFAERNIPISVMDRASGFIGTQQLAVPLSIADSLANCGTMIGIPLYADFAVYNALVRGDSSTSTVLVTIKFTNGGKPNDPVIRDCSTLGRWESTFEADVKRRAEGS